MKLIIFDFDGTLGADIIIGYVLCKQSHLHSTCRVRQSLAEEGL